MYNIYIHIIIYNSYNDTSNDIRAEVQDDRAEVHLNGRGRSIQKMVQDRAFEKTSTIRATFTDY